MNSTFDQGAQQTEHQINIAGNYYHYGPDPQAGSQSPSASSPSVLHNLPQRDYTQFIGRAAELQKVQQILRPYPQSQHAFVSIDGIGGVGKSTLALEVAHRFLDQHDHLPPEERFAAIVWTSAKERILTGDGIKPRYQTHRTLDDLYRAIAITLQREDIAKAVFEQQAALLHSALIQRRTLVIVDNLETIDDEAVVNFIRELPAPTKVIVTTRHRIDVAYAIRLTGMPWEDAERLITQECRTRNVDLTPSDIRRLFDRTGGIPLAIVWSVAQMGFGYPPETVLTRLGSPTNDIIRFCFDQAVAQLVGQPAKKLLIVLSYFTSTASREALGQVAQLSELDRDDGLVTLEKLSLVNKQANLFSLLPVTKVFAAEVAKHSEGIYVYYGKRWLEYFILLYNAQDELAPEFRVKHGRLKTFDDVPNVIEAIDWSYQYATSTEILSLNVIAASYLDSVGQWNLVSGILTRALELAHKIQDFKAIARLHHYLGAQCQEQGRFEEAQQHFHESLQKYRLVGDLESEAATLHWLSATMRKNKNFAQSRELLKQARAITHGLNSADLLALHDMEDGVYYRDIGDLEKSRESFTRVRDYFEQRVQESPRDEYLATGVWGQLALISYYQGKPQEAKALCLQAIDYFRTTGTKGFFATLMYRLALAEEALGEFELARKHVDEALYWFQRLGMRPDIPDALALQARIADKGQPFGFKPSTELVDKKAT